MCTREMTLGEEIINLTKRGIDVPTVERMYRKYIDLDEKGKSEGGYAIDLGPLFPTFDIGDTVRYCRADVEATLNLFRDTVHNPYSILPADIKVGDKMMVPLGKLGNFTATVQKVTNNKVLFIFDDYVAKRPMNEDGGNAGGYSQSDLKKWIDTELYNMFPAVLKQRMTGLSIPTLGEICGWADKFLSTETLNGLYLMIRMFRNLVQMTLMSIVLFHGRCLAERISIGHASTARISTTITSTWIAILIMIFQIS